MPNEQIDIEELFKKDVEEIDTSRKVSNKLVESASDSDKKKKSKKNKDGVAYKAKSILLKSVLPSVGTGLVCFVLGGLVFSSGDSASQRVQQAQTIKSSSTVLENLNSLKDSQIESLKKQLAEMTTTDQSGNQLLTQNGQNVNNLAFTKDVNSAVSAGIDEFFTKLISISPTASESEIQSIQPDLTKYMTESSASSELYSTLTGASAAKELGKKTTKISSATVTLARSDNENNRVYLVAVPISTPSDEKIYNAFYIVQTNNEYKIEFAKYAGYSGGSYSIKLHELFKSSEEIANMSGVQKAEENSQ